MNTEPEQLGWSRGICDWRYSSWARGDRFMQKFSFYC